MNKCNDCKYGVFCESKGKEKDKFFCAKFQGYISLSEYKEIKFCRFYEKEVKRYEKK